MRLSEQHYIGFTRSWYRRAVYKHNYVTVVFNQYTKVLSFRVEYKGESIYDSAENGVFFSSQRECIEACEKYVTDREKGGNLDN